MKVYWQEYSVISFVCDVFIFDAYFSVDYRILVGSYFFLAPKNAIVSSPGFHDFCSNFRNSSYCCRPLKHSCLLCFIINTLSAVFSSPFLCTWE